MIRDDSHFVSHCTERGGEQHGSQWSIGFSGRGLSMGNEDARCDQAATSILDHIVGCPVEVPQAEIFACLGLSQ